MGEKNGYGSIIVEHDLPSEQLGEEFFQQARQGRRPSLAESIRSSMRSSIRSLVESSFVLEGAPASVREYGGTSTILSEVINISKNLIGGGVLSLSGGIAMYSDNPLAVFSAAFWTALMGIIFGYYCFLVARVCRLTHAATYSEMWGETVGEAGAIAVPMANALKAGLGNLAYSSILSQTLKSLLETIGVNLSRVACLFLITGLGVLPLCLLKNFNVLAPFSVLGTSGILFTACAMGYRYLDGSYAPGGQFHEDNEPDLRPLFGDQNDQFSLAVLPLVCMLYEAFVMHYNSARFYTELKDASLPRFAFCVSAAFGFASVVYIAIACLGYLTFGGNSSSYILNNYSPYDPLATLCRLAVGISTLTTYP